MAKHELGVDVELAGGELDVVAEGLAELFFAVEGQDVEGGVHLSYPEFMAAVVEEGARCVEHVQASMAVFAALSSVLENCRVTPCSSL
ncbi:hypothetical protein D3C81_2007850 [compost metagenome]